MQNGKKVYGCPKCGGVLSRVPRRGRRPTEKDLKGYQNFECKSCRSIVFAEYDPKGLEIVSSEPFIRLADGSLFPKSKAFPTDTVFEVTKVE